MKYYNKFIGTKNRMVRARGRGWEWEMGSLFNGYIVSVWENEKVLELDGGNGCITM